MKSINLYLLLILAFLFVFESKAQNTYSVYSAKSKLTVKGTSSVHDWEIVSKNIEGETSVLIVEKTINSIEQAHIKIPVSSLESKNSIMDKKTHKALKEKQFNTIDFKLSGFYPQQAENIEGNLAIAGETKKIVLPVQLKVLSENEILVNAKISLKMSDFNITPPTAMMGTLKTGDVVNVSFEILLVKQ